MATIDPAGRLAAALREQATALRRHGEANRATAAAPRPGMARAAPDLARLLAERIRCIDAADPERRQKAVRVVLESAIAREFGADLLNDSAFPAMLDAIQQQMQQDAETAAAVHALGDALLAGRLP